MTACGIVALWQKAQSDRKGRANPVTARAKVSLRTPPFPCYPNLRLSGTDPGEAFSCLNAGFREQAMANVAVIGAQWGDEGKGKIVDWLSERAEVVVRFQGGHNAGHTLVIGNQTYKLALLPSGVVRKGKLSIIGNGVVVDPWHFLEEVKKVIEPGRVGDAREPQDRQPRRADPAAASRPRRLARGRARHHQDRHDAARHRPGLRGQGRPPRHPRRRPRPSPTSWRSRSTRCWPITIRCAPGSASRWSMPASSPPTCSSLRRRSCPSPRMCGSGSTGCAPPASASCSRARRPPCSTSTTAPIRSSPRPTPWRRRR